MGKMIVWRWKPDVDKYVGKPGIAGIHYAIYTFRDLTPYGRDGWVGFIEEDKIGVNNA